MLWAHGLLKALPFTSGHEKQSTTVLTGVLASASIFIEKKARRAELALYVLPRGVQSLFSTLLRRRLLPDLPLWEVLLFAACMGALMRYRSELAPCPCDP